MTSIFDAALDIASVLTLVGLVAASVRLYLGPSRADRVVALDLITVLLVAIASLAALRFENAAYLDLGLTLALVGFLATVAFARYVESAPEREPAEAAGEGGTGSLATNDGGTSDGTRRPTASEDPGDDRTVRPGPTPEDDGTASGYGTGAAPEARP